MDNNKNIAVLRSELDWLAAVIDQVIASYFLHEGHERRWQDIPVPDLGDMDNPYANSVKKWELDVYGRLALALALAPHLRQELLDVFFARNQVYDRGYTEFGGVIHKNHSGFLPTGQTLSFLLTSLNPELLPTVLNIFDKEYILVKEQVLELCETEAALPVFCGLLALNRKWFHYFVTGRHNR